MKFGQLERIDVDLSNYIVKEAQKIELKKDFCHMSFNDYRFASIMCPIANEIYEANTQCYGDLEDLWEDFTTFTKKYCADLDFSNSNFLLNSFRISSDAQSVIKLSKSSVLRYS